MADFIAFTEGLNEIVNNGLPSTCSFDLSTKPCSGTGAHAAGDTFGGGYGVITGTGYAAQTESEPSASGGVVSFAAKAWTTGSATDWPASVKSCVLRSGSKILCAWNLQAGGTARNLSGAGTTETFTPTLTLAGA